MPSSVADPGSPGAAASLLEGAGARAGRGHLAQVVVQTAVYATVAFLVLSPIAMLLYGSVRTAPPGAEGAFTLANFREILSPRYLEALKNTLVLGASAAVLCTVVGTALAWLVFRTDLPGRRLLAVLVTSTFYFPSFLTAEAWGILLAPKSGLLNNLGRTLLPGFDGINIYSLAGMIWVTALAYVPYTFLFLAGPFQSMDPALEEAASMSGASRARTVFTVTLPLVSYAILSGALLTFILAVGLFGVPAIIGMPAQIYVLVTQIYSLLEFYPSNYQVAAALAVLLMGVTVAAVWLQRFITGRRSHTTITGKGYRPRPFPLGRLRWIAFGLCVGYFVLAVLLPTLALLYVSLQRFYTGTLDFSRFTLHNYREILFVYPITWRAFRNSLVLSAGGATVAIALSALVSYMVVRGRMRARGLLETLTMLPAAVPGLVISVGLLWAYVRSPIYGTIVILLVSYVTHYLPQGFRVVSSNLVQMDNALEESARVSGASWLRTLKDIVLPLVRPALASGWLLLFVAFFRELSSAVLLYSHGNEVLSVAIWDLHQNGNLGMLAALAVLMLLVVYGVFFVLQAVGGGVAGRPQAEG
ncbi:MAG TPA: iron ABC transporter permease [Thermodesulfobacteriota bacterium]